MPKPKVEIARPIGLKRAKVQKVDRNAPNLETVFEDDGDPLEAVEYEPGEIQTNADREMSEIVAQIKAEKKAQYERFRTARDRTITGRVFRATNSVTNLCRRAGGPRSTTRSSTPGRAAEMKLACSPSIGAAPQSGSRTCISVKRVVIITTTPTAPASPGPLREAARAVVGLACRAPWQWCSWRRFRQPLIDRVREWPLPLLMWDL
jgi:hypothetical protein